MEEVGDTLRALDRMQRALALELAACVAAGASLFAVSERVGVGADAQFAFLLCLAGFGAAATQLVPRLLHAALFRCPRCSGLFHAATRASRPVVRLRACAHCRLPVRAGAS